MRLQLLSLFLLLIASGCPRPQSISAAELPVTPPPVAPIFEDATRAAGITFESRLEGKTPRTILQTIGEGVAFFDFDNDGNLDLLFVARKPALYQGDGKGHFRPVPLNLPPAHYLGVAVGDFDNDNRPDLYLSAYQGGALLQNQENGRFTDVTAQSGLKPQPWGSSASFFDFDKDGDLDLFIGNYVDFGPKTKPQLCNYHGVMGSCGPNSYTALRGVLYRNLGNGRFRDDTHTLGLDKAPGKTLGVAAAPWGNEVALAVANDQQPSSLYVFAKNEPTDRAVEAGTAFARDGKVYAGMGVDWGDWNNDGQLDLAAAAYTSQAKLIFQRDGTVFEARDIAQIGLMSSVDVITFGLKWLDYDNDGWLDLLLANGHVQDNAKEVTGIYPGGGNSFGQPLILYRNEEGKRFTDVRQGLTGGAERELVGRGLATGDYDNDGRIDAVVLNSEGAPVLLHNVYKNTGNWLRVSLEGKGGGYGALLTLTLPDGKKRIRHCQADGSYESASDPRVWFGLGKATGAALTVRWPGGKEQTVPKVAANQTITLREPQ